MTPTQSSSTPTDLGSQSQAAFFYLVSATLIFTAKCTYIHYNMDNTIKILSTKHARYK